MKCLLLLVALCAATTFALPTVETTTTSLCVPGETKHEDCNECICSADGSGYQCTERGCLNKDEQEHGKICEPGSVKKEDCNTCTCTPDGKNYMCTLMFCDTHHVHKRENEPDKCKPGTSKIIDCNICNCAAVGVWACTLKSCEGGDDSAVLRSRRDAETGVVKEVTTDTLATTPCTPGEKTNADCNTCTCAADGSGYACTRKMCNFATHDHKRRAAETEEVKEVTTDTLATTPCTPGEKTKVDCNTCTCAADGTGYACTRQMCNFATHDRKRRSDEASEKECEPGETKQIDCNTCRCTADGKLACTRKMCLPPSETRTKREEPAKCNPGEVKQVECNTCRCTTDGELACTRKKCLPPVNQETTERTKRQAGTCVPGSTKKEDCNTCTCNEKGTGYRCTLLACGNEQIREKRDTPVNLPARTCEPNTVFKQDCNTCRCNAEGTFAACTFKLCIPGLE